MGVMMWGLQGEREPTKQPYDAVTSQCDDRRGQQCGRQVVHDPFLQEEHGDHHRARDVQAVLQVNDRALNEMHHMTHQLPTAIPVNMQVDTS